MTQIIQANPRGIPQAPFIVCISWCSKRSSMDYNELIWNIAQDNVEAFVPKTEVEATMTKFQEMIS